MCDYLCNNNHVCATTAVARLVRYATQNTRQQMAYSLIWDVNININNFSTEKYAFKRVLDNSPMLPECWGVVVLERR